MMSSAQLTGTNIIPQPSPSTPHHPNTLSTQLLLHIFQPTKTTINSLTQLTALRINAFALRTQILPKQGMVDVSWCVENVG